MKLGRYEIMCKLGVGGMADVYLAHQPGPFSASKLVVIKQLRPGVLADEQFVKMFADESRIAVRLNHPNVVHTYEVVAEGNDYYLTLEFLDGKSLHQVLHRITRERMPLALHIWVLMQVLSGLHYAHELKDFNGSSLGIVHRDVSPSNVFITYEGEAKLLDFGIAKSVGAVSSTQEGIIKGKLGYAAPEQCLCTGTDGRTDVFAVGVMLWEAIAGRKRSLGETDASTYQSRVQGTELAIEEVVPSAPRELCDICNRALAQQPEDRYQSALEFRQALEQYLQAIDWKDGTAQLRAFMNDNFGDDYAEMRQRIDEYIGNSRSMGFRPSILPPTQAQSIPPQSGRIETGYPRTHNSHSDSTPPFATASVWRKRLWVGGAVIAGGVIAIIAMRSLNGPFTDSSAPVTSVNAPTQTGSSAAPAHLEQRPSHSTEQVTVSLSADPSNAVLRLDGRRVSNPYRAIHGKDSVPHHLTVSLAGYETLEQELLFELDIEVNVALKAFALPKRKSVASRPSTTVSSREVSKPTTNENSKTISPTVAAMPQPGEDLRSATSRAKARDIEETDPYKR